MWNRKRRRERSVSEPVDAFSRLQSEHERTQFVFYGYRKAADGSLAGPYFTLAHSLSEALADLMANEGNQGGYLIRDAFLAADDDGRPALHVQLVSIDEIRRKTEKRDS
jgi:hypothetical protein